MTRRQITPWYRTSYPAAMWSGVELVEIAPAYVPMLLADMEARKTETLWRSEADYVVAYDAIIAQQVALLMGATQYLARVGFYQMGYARDVELAPDGFPLVELPEATLIAIRAHLGDPGDLTIYSRVEAIRLLLEAGEGLDAEQLGELLKIVALLSA